LKTPSDQIEIKIKIESAMDQAMDLRKPSDLARRAAEAREALSACDLCARQCRVDRTAGQTGFCGLGAESRWFREIVVYGIEMELIPAHALYLTGCNLRCAFCLVEPWIVAPATGVPWDSDWMAARVRQRQGEGARSLLVLGGEPTVNLPGILEMLAALAEQPTLAWDSNMLFSARSRALLDGVVDVYVGDLKFGNDACAHALAGVDGYLGILEENLRFAERTARLIVRHLMLPGHFECCTLPALAWMAARLTRPRLSLFWGYQPPGDTKNLPELAGVNVPRDFQRARTAAEALGIELVN